MINTKHLKKYLEQEFPGVDFKVRGGKPRNRLCDRHVSIHCYGGSYFEELQRKLKEYLIANDISGIGDFGYGGYGDKDSVQYHTIHGLVSIYWSEQPPYPDIYSKATGDVTFVPIDGSKRHHTRIIHLECGHEKHQTCYRHKLYPRPTRRFWCHECSYEAGEKYERERLELLAKMGIPTT